MTHDAPVGTTVTTRFAIPAVTQCAGIGPYKSEALRSTTISNISIQEKLLANKHEAIRLRTP
jgi:hypothetical protein